MSYDLIVIGGGSAGLVGARFARQLGLRVALAEAHRLGGDCTWTGCVPSKALLRVARLAHEIRTAGTFGLDANAAPVDLARVLECVRAVQDEIYQTESPETLQAEGIDVIAAPVRFRDPYTLETGGATLTAKHILICTGARPSQPDIPGLATVDYLTYESIWQLQKLPEHLMVLGGGPLGAEMAQAFRRLGSRVTLVEREPHLLPRDEPAAGDALAGVFRAEGIDPRLGVAVERVEQAGSGIRVLAGGQPIEGTALLVALGRLPNVESLGLDKAGVTVRRGIVVDKRLRTSQKHIYAAGDVAGGFQFTHYAGYQGFTAVRNMFLPGAGQGVHETVPWVTFTDPEVAHMGLREAEARRQHGDDVTVTRWEMRAVDRAVTEGDTAGFIQVVHRRKGTILGATIVAARAGEMIHEWVLAADHGISVGDLSGSLHVYPTYAIANQQLATEVRVRRLLSGATGKLVRGLVRLGG